eukprot:TRINITY_DN4833_c0_g1_i2.p1 TRINITY_DN4833_c0_g1~~TRINITY_DN4833_c0_g1_i2.p1  ORF type:complete len:421 (-),score=76.08 TRINITY_DN4833_c0_g1_i2:26-1288(-)
MRAVFYFRTEEQLRAVFLFRRSWLAFSKATKVQQKRDEKKWQDDPELRGLINFGVGMFHLIFSLVPPSLQLLTSIAGFEADRKGALKELYECYNSGCTMAAPAGLVLLMLEKFLFKKKEEADVIWERILAEYSKSFIIGYMGGFVLKLEGDLEGAIKAFEITQRFSVDEGFRQLEASTHYSIAYCNACGDDWESSKNHFQLFIDTPIEIANKNFRPWAAYLLGLSYWITQPDSRQTIANDKIAPLYRKAIKEWIREEEGFDIFARRKMKNFLKSDSFSPLEEVTAILGLLVEGKQSEKARPHLDKLRNLLEETEAERDYHAIWAFYTGECLKIEKDLVKAVEILQRALEEDGKVKQETWVIPAALLSLADIAATEKDWTKAKEYMKKLKKYSKYDWEKIIAFQVFALKQTIKEAKAQEAV